MKYRQERSAGLTPAGLQEVFREHRRYDEWHEVLRLLHGLTAAWYAGQFISELLSRRKEPEGHRAMFLGAQCLQEVREVGVIREVRAHARQELLLLARFDFPFFYEEWGPEGQAAGRIRSRAVQELARGWKEDPATLPWLKDRAARDENEAVRQAAVLELARGWKEDPEVQASLASLRT